MISANAGKYLPRMVVTNYRGYWKGISAEGGKRLARNALAEAVKTSYKYIQRIEGKTPPDLRISSIQKIAKALRVKISQLVEK